MALNRMVTMAVAEPLSEVFTEVGVAPAYEPEALEALRARANLRILEGPPPGRADWILDLRSIDGGLLVQTVDQVDDDSATWRVVTDR